ncbi:hypothetical protein EXIGLDRAFT_777672 [Exidia glandulosa HHB12029]|uniref:Uncharacterized protein n=1 Tax=Exidia glandulosa HHB12029 TaxID=1314781 RepID=A0A165CX07_EXIGL|nr:hypothetical protein EXIGLDRAFT_777672 [Exidia glandulosa HHB12029]
MSRQGLYNAPDYYDTPQTSHPGARARAESVSTAYEKKKAARQRAVAFHQRIADFVRTTVLPGLNGIAAEYDCSPADAREAAHLAMPVVAKQRELRLWDAVMSIARKETSSWDDAQIQAVETYGRLRDAMENEDWDNDELVLYETLRMEMEANRGVPAMPKTDGKTTRATLLEVTRTVDKCQNLLQTLFHHAQIDFALVVTKGRSKFEFMPQVVFSQTAEKFVELKLGMSSRKFVYALDEYAVWGDNVRDADGRKTKASTMVTNALRSGLRVLTGDEKLNLKWKQYDSLCIKHEVELRGWPDDIPFGQMHLLGDKKCERLYTLIKDGTVRWEKKTTSTPTEPAVTLDAEATPRSALLTPPPTQRTAPLPPTASAGPAHTGPHIEPEAPAVPTLSSASALYGQEQRAALIPVNSGAALDVPRPIPSLSSEPLPLPFPPLPDDFDFESFNLNVPPVPFSYPDPNMFSFNPSHPFRFGA